jgi:hypothetical protein
MNRDDGRSRVTANRAPFYAIAARMIRKILVDYGRRRCAATRGSGAARPASSGPSRWQADRLLKSFHLTFTRLAFEDYARRIMVIKDPWRRAF